MFVKDIKSVEFNPYYQVYINQTPENMTLLESLRHNSDDTVSFLRSIEDSKFGYRYTDDKWTIKELLQHVIDTERVFAYRALRFARQDTLDLLGFEQDDFVATSEANHRSKDELIDDFKATRLATISLFLSFNDAMLQHVGRASGNPMSARATGFIIVGHTKHHIQIVKERYL